MDSQDNVKFTDKPCPKCKEGGGPTGYVVNMECPQCLGTGRARKE